MKQPRDRFTRLVEWMRKNAVHYAALVGPIAFATGLQARQALVDRELVRAVNAANEPEVAAALRSGADPNHTNGFRLTGPEWLLRSMFGHITGHTQSSQADNMSVLCYAAARHNRAIVEDLLSDGADPNVVDYAGMTAVMRTVLMDSCSGDNAPKDLRGPVVALAAYGADVNLVGPGGETAAHLAFKCGNYAALRALLIAGANPHIPDEAGNTVAIYAADGEHRYADRMLADYGWHGLEGIQATRNRQSQIGRSQVTPKASMR